MTKIQMRRGTAAQWSAANPVLSAGELGVDTSSGKVKLGNGTTDWNGLPFLFENHTHPNATITTSGFMSSSDKYKLDNLGVAPQLDTWTEALRYQQNACAVYVNLGDSIANGGNATSFPKAWVNRLAARFTDRLPTRLDATTLAAKPSNGVAVYNGAVGGRTSANYIDASYVSRIGTLKPHLITHMVKANDQGQGITPTQYKANILSWINQIKAVSPNTVHVLINQHARWDGSFAYPSNDYRDKLVELATETGSAYLDIDRQFMKWGIPGEDRYKLMDTDLLHFHDRGNQVYAEIIGDYIGAPRIDYLPREIIRATSWAYGNLTTVTTVGEFEIKAKPYLREGLMYGSFYGAPGSNTVDMILRVTPDGGSRVDLNTVRLPWAQQSHQISAPVTLLPNTRYLAQLDMGIYGSNFDANGNSGYSQFFADVSPT